MVIFSYRYLLYSCLFIEPIWTMNIIIQHKFNFFVNRASTLLKIVFNNHYLWINIWKKVFVWSLQVVGKIYMYVRKSGGNHRLNSNKTHNNYLFLSCFAHHWNKNIPKYITQSCQTPPKLCNYSIFAQVQYYTIVWLSVDIISWLYNPVLV